ncbi:Pxr1, partial [Ophiophagus hannah]
MSKVLLQRIGASTLPFETQPFHLGFGKKRLHRRHENVLRYLPGIYVYIPCKESHSQITATINCSVFECTAEHQLYLLSATCPNLQGPNRCLGQEAALLGGGGPPLLLKGRGSTTLHASLSLDNARVDTEGRKEEGRRNRKRKKGKKREGRRWEEKGREGKDRVGKERKGSGERRKKVEKEERKEGKKEGREGQRKERKKEERRRRKERGRKEG